MLHSVMNWGRSYYIILHLTSNLLSHYLLKFECSTVQLYTVVTQLKSVANRLFKYLQECHFLDYMSVPINLLSGAPISPFITESIFAVLRNRKKIRKIRTSYRPSLNDREWLFYLKFYFAPIYSPEAWLSELDYNY